MSLTIDEAIEQLKKLREQSKLGGETCLVIALPETDYIEVDRFHVENDPDGALATVCGTPATYGRAALTKSGFLLTIQVAAIADCEAEATDGLGEMLREAERSGFILDWQFTGSSTPFTVPADYSEGDIFNPAYDPL